MNKRIVKITDIRQNQHHPGVVYASLVDVESGELCVSAQLEYVVKRAQDPEYECVNLKVTNNGFRIEA